MSTSESGVAKYEIKRVVKIQGNMLTCSVWSLVSNQEFVHLENC